MGNPNELEDGSSAEIVNVIEEPASITEGGSMENEKGFYGKLQRIAGKFGVEKRGIERVPEHERTDKSILGVGAVMLSANMLVTMVAIGVLSVPVFRLGFVDAFLAIIFFNVLGALPVAFFATLGPKFGLRQVILSRYFFGYYGVKIVAIFNCLTCLGWGALNAIVGAELLHAVSNRIPGAAAIIIIAAVSLLVSMLGYRVVHKYGLWSWIPSFIVFLIILGVFAKSGKFSNVDWKEGKAEAGSILSFGAAIFGAATGWVGLAADYSVYQPVNTSRAKIFLVVFTGLMFPLLFTQFLGLAIATATLKHPEFMEAFATNQVGGLLAEVLFPALGGFGKFCLTILALAVVAGNCVGMYSLAFNLQILAAQTQRIPRFVWSFVGTVIYCAVAIPAYSSFASVLQNMMLILAYWLSLYEGIAFPEHVIFRGGKSGYCVEDYNSASELPPGYAAIGALSIGVAGIVLGMSQTWFTGPIGKAAGADIGFELGFGWTFCSYVVLRKLEKQYFRR